MRIAPLPCLAVAALATAAALAQVAQPPRIVAKRAATNEVRITVDGEYRVMDSNGWPDHAPGAFPRRGNPNTPSPQSYHFRMPLKPMTAETPVRRGMYWWGVALNGVPFEPGTAETWNNNPQSGWRYEAATGFLDLGLDQHNAHVQPTGAYHYHALPVGLVEKLGGDGKRMLQVGWAADGFPVYTSYAYADPKDAKSALRKMKPSYRLKQGARPVEQGGPGGRYDGRFTQDFEFVKGLGDLDECNGRTGATPEFPQSTYYYCITSEFPFVPRMWRGEPDSSFGKGGPQAGGGGPAGGLGGGFVPPLIKALDLNGDGIIDADEIKKAPASLRTLDRNGDGRLTPDEYRPPFPGGPGPRE